MNYSNLNLIYLILAGINSLVTWRIGFFFISLFFHYANILFFLVAALLIKCRFSQNYPDDPVGETLLGRF